MTKPTVIDQHVRRAHLSVTIMVTALCGVALLLVILLFAGDLPGRLATHFDLSGAADDDMTRGAALSMFAVVGIGLPALLIAVFAAMQWWRGERARAFAGFLAALPVGLTTLFVNLILANRGADSAEQVRLSPWLMLLALGLAIVVGGAVARLLPRGVPRESPESVTPMALAPTERASWFGRVETGRLPMAVLAGSVLVLVVATLASGIWWLWLVTALVALLLLVLTSFVVTVDASGLTWRSIIGFPRRHIPMSEITGAAVIDVSPADFGGIGLRVTPGALGIITRQGSALEVSHGKRRFVATVEDAATGAGLLLGYLDGGHGRGGMTRR